MNSSPPRLPRLGGHKSTPTTKPIPPATTPSGPFSINPSAHIEPAQPSKSPERPYIDVGYDDDRIPYAQPVHLLASLHGDTTPSSPQQQAPSPPRSGRPSSSSPPFTFSKPAPPSWKEAMKSEVLLGQAQLRNSSSASNNNRSPALALVAAAHHSSTSSESGEDDSIEYASHDSGDRVAQVPPSPFPSTPEVFPALTSAVNPIAGIPKSPGGASSSIAADTPRSILRHPDRDRDTWSPRSGPRRISFIDLSPLRDDSVGSRGPDDNEPHRENLIAEEEDEYEFAEPLLHYKTHTPPTFTPSAEPNEIGSRERTRIGHGTPPSSLPRSPGSLDDSPVDVNVNKSRHMRSPDTRGNDRQERRSSLNSPERPVSAGRSPTRSPPRDTDVVRQNFTATSVSAPPPPEEENDSVTLDRAAPQPRCSPNRSGKAIEKKYAGRDASAGRDDDVLTQPHNQNRHPSRGSKSEPTAAVASVRQRLPTRRRWPSDAYVDEPPTEISTTQRDARSGEGGHRESLDPEDDMGSSEIHSSDTSQDDYSCDEYGDAGPLFNYESPVKEAPLRHSSVDRDRTPSTQTVSSSRSSPHRSDDREHDRTRSPNRSQPRAPSGRLPEQRSCNKSTSESCASSVVSSRSKSGSNSSSNRERPIPSTPPSLTMGLDSGLRQRHSPSRDERTTPLLTQSTLLPSPMENRDAVPVVASRETSGSRSRDHSPSTITTRSSGQSFGEEGVANQVPLFAPHAKTRVMPPCPRMEGAPSNSSARDEGERCRNHHAHSEASERASSVNTSHRRNRQGTPTKAGQPSVTPLAAAMAWREPARWKKMEREEPRMYVDPLLRERQHRHDVARQQSPMYLAKQDPSTEDAVPAPRHHKPRSPRRTSTRNVDKRGGVTEPISLRDIIARCDTPDVKQKNASSAPSKKSVLTASALVPFSKKEGEGVNARSESSNRSNDGVPAEDLVWDDLTPNSQESSATSPALPMSSTSAAAAALATTPGGHKVFRKKLVMVVRRKKSGLPASEDDPVMQISLMPYKEESPMVKHAEEQQEALRQERLAGESRTSRNKGSTSGGSGANVGTVSALTKVNAPPLERLIDHIQLGRKSFVSSRHSSRNTHIRGERVGENDDHSEGGKQTGSETNITDEERRQFRRALSVASSRSASRRSSVTRAAHLRRPRPESAAGSGRPPTLPKDEKQRSRSSSSTASHSTSTSEHSSAVRERGSRSTELPRPPKPAPTVTAASRETKDAVDATPSRRDESTMTRARHHHHHHCHHSSSSRCNSVQPELPQKRQQRSGSTAKVVNTASHRSTSAERSFSPPSKSKRTVSAPPPSLPDVPYRPTQNDEYYFGAGLEKEVAQLEQESADQQRIGITPVAMPLLPRLVFDGEKGSRGQHGNAEAENAPVWSSWSNDEDGLENDTNRIASGTGDGSSQRQRQLQASATQTDRFGPTVMDGPGKSGMPLVAGSPVVRPSIGAGSVPVKMIAPSRAVNLAKGPLTAATIQAATPVPIDSDSESPASFLKRQTVPPSSTASAQRAAGSSAASMPLAGAPAPSGYAPTYATSSILPEKDALFSRGLEEQQLPFSASHPSLPVAPPTNKDINSAFLPPAATSSAGVPLFVPALTVDNVSHLTRDWQSTLRERSSKAKQNAMEQFLIASAEAGAAKTMNSAYMRGTGSAIGAPADLGVPRRWPMLLELGSPSNEYYGQLQQRAPATAGIATASLVSQTLPPHLLPQSFWDAEGEMQHGKTCGAAAAVQQQTQIAAAQPKPNASAVKAAKTTRPTAQVVRKGKTRGRSSSTPQPDSFDLVEGSDVVEKLSNIGGDGGKTVETVDTADPLSPSRSRSQTPPTPASLASEQSPPPPPSRRHRHPYGQPHNTTAIMPPSEDPVKSQDSVHHKCAKRTSRVAAAASAVEAAAQGRRGSAQPATKGFTIAELDPEISKPKGEAGARHPHSARLHPTDHRDRGRSADTSSASSRHKEQSKKKEEDGRQKKKERKEKKRKADRQKSSKDKPRRSRDAKAHHRDASAASSLSSNAASESRLSIPVAFDLSQYKLGLHDDSDVDSDKATSIEFQLSRLLLQREKDVSRALASLQQKQEKSGAKEKKAEKTREEEERKKKEKKKHHRRREIASSDEEKKRRPSKDENEKETKTDNKRHRSASAGAKKPRKNDKHKSKHHRWKSVSKPQLLTLPQPLSARTHDAWTDDIPPLRNHAELLFGERHPSSVPYKSMGEPRCDGAPTSPHTRRDYTAGEEHERPSSSARSYFRSHSGGLDNNYSFDAASSRYARRRPYTPSASSRWADTPRRSYGNRDAAQTPATPASSYEPSECTYGRAARPSTNWTHYVREAERSDRRRMSNGSTYASPASRYSSPSSTLPRHTSYEQRRQSMGGNAASPRTGTGSYRPQTFPSTTPRYTPHTADYDDIDDIPRRNYFNDDAAAAAPPPSPPPTHSATGRHRSFSTDVPRPFYRRQRQAVAQAKKKKEDDILVSTPSQDRDGSFDYWEDRVTERTKPRRGGAPPPPPPPPSSPQDSPNSNTRMPSTSGQAFGMWNGEARNANALPFISEHNVADAQSAHDFAEGLKEILSALEQYKSSA